MALTSMATASLAATVTVAFPESSTVTVGPLQVPPELDQVPWTRSQ